MNKDKDSKAIKNIKNFLGDFIDDEFTIDNYAEKEAENLINAYGFDDALKICDETIEDCENSNINPSLWFKVKNYILKKNN